MATKLYSEGAKLKSFETHFQVLYSLSIDAEILKISLLGLPRQYGRANGRAQELCADMIANLSTFGSVIDCGMVSGISGNFTGRGYAVLELDSSSTVDETHRNIFHSLHWQYARLSAKTGIQSSSSSDAVTVYATWANMGSYCRYCHQDTHGCRAHPRLAKDSAFCEKLEQKISDTVAKFAPDLDVALKWQELKSVTQKTAKAHSRKVAFDMAQAEKRLQHRRRHIMSNIRRNPDQSPENLPLLRVVERQLDSFQHDRIETLALRSGIRWRELGELSAGYLKKTVATGIAKQLVLPLVHPTTNVLCSSVEDMLDATTTFYSDIYSPEPIDQNAIDEPLKSLPPELHLSSLDQTRLQFPITFDDILIGISHSPPKSSPGMGGIPYEILKLIVSHPDCREIVLAVYNNALSCGSFSESWNGTCVSLLPKKCNLSDLRNRWPISLINTDAKVFTRIINSRMIRCAFKLVSPYQTGFVRSRFIADNDLLMRLLIDHAQLSHSAAIALSLDPSTNRKKDGQNKETVAKDDKFTSELFVIACEENDVVVSTSLLDVDYDICSSFTTINDLDFEQTDEDEFNEDKTDNGINFATNEE
ncbi:hypothetical protein G6F37_008965 [Rhizopus arrhizus]|nr:hypothetical protein G6F38_009625 [Rhizopus arrhizus]KAG1154974.1 hypothetical protein G6F37_008965 [Rhizopus arrhizus]